MIWSLAAAALLGAVAILTNGSEVIWRIAGTTGTTAACAALMMAASVLLDKEAGRASGIVGMTAALFAALFTLILIWDLTILIPTTRPDETCGMTIANLIICALPAMAFLRGRTLGSVRVACNVGVVLTGATFVLYLIPSWMIHQLTGIGSSDDWLFTATATGLIGLLAVACLVSIDARQEGGARKFLPMLGIGGLASAVVAWCLVLYAIWMQIDESSGAFTAAISIACVVGLTQLAMLVPLSPGQTWVRIGTIGTAVTSAICVDILAFSDWSDPGEFVTRLGGAAGFVASCGSLALIIFARINRPMAGASRAYREATDISVVCPGCRSKQVLPLGDSACPVCHLRFNIRVDEPRCTQCDYLLIMLKSDRCPECGTPIGQKAEDLASIRSATTRSP